MSTSIDREMASPSERRGIPAAPFVQDVEAFLAETGSNAGSALSLLQDRLQQYKLVEIKLLGQKRDLQAKIPDIKKCLQVAGMLQAQQDSGEEMTVDYEVAEGIYSQAVLDKSNSLCLWLGANVMLEYTCEEAESLLKKNLDNASSSLATINEDLHFLRDQVTVTEVTIARVFNWDVHRRRKERSAQDEGQ